MDAPRDKIVLLASSPEGREVLLDLLRETAADVAAVDDVESAAAAGADLLVVQGPTDLLPALRGQRILALVSSADECVTALDLGAADALATPWNPRELEARLRVQLRALRAERAFAEKAHVAEEGFKLSQTAFEALAVTERMKDDALRLNRALKIGAAAVFLAVAILATVFYFYSRGARKDAQQAYGVMAQVQRSLAQQHDLMERTRKMRDEAEKYKEHRQRVEEETQSLRDRLESAASADEVASLRKELAVTTTHLKQIDEETRVAQSIIRTAGPSVCLLHVVVKFRDHFSGRRLRWSDEKPPEDAKPDDKSKVSLDGAGPEVRLDFFGTGFLVSSDGRILTNHHVAEPWWENEGLKKAEEQALEPIAAEMSAYFPNEPRVFQVRTVGISPEVDLAVVQGDLRGLRRPVLALDGSRQAAVTGDPVVLMGYPTGLDAILARASEETVKAIVAAADGDPRNIMGELARRRLIRPLATQGHIGDQQRDRIIYDAQTTSGGSGGPLFNRSGKVIGVNFAMLEGFTGSNFGIPARFAVTLLAPPKR